MLFYQVGWHLPGGIYDRLRDLPLANDLIVLKELVNPAKFRYSFYYVDQEI